MAEPVVAQFRRVYDRALWWPSMQMRWAGEAAITLLHRESPNDAPSFSPPSRLRTLQTHVVHQCPCFTHSHQPHWPWSRLLHRNCDRRCIVVWVSAPNTGINYSSWFMEEGSPWNNFPLTFTPNGCFCRPTRCGTGESGRSPAANFYQQ